MDLLTHTDNTSSLLPSTNIVEMSNANINGFNSEPNMKRIYCDDQCDTGKNLFQVDVPSIPPLPTSLLTLLSSPPPTPLLPSAHITS